MIKQRLTRRQFFKASVFGAGVAAGWPVIGLATVAAVPAQTAQATLRAAAQQPQGPAIPQPTFNPIAANTTFGPLTDISMGWDGTLWGIDAQGAPHIYDSLNDQWAQHGDGIDAAALSVVSPTQQTLYVFKGSNVLPIDAITLKTSAPTTIAALWPNLPDSFKLGVSGAIGIPERPGLILFNSGRYLSTDGSIPAGKLTDLPGWPQTPTWKDGVIDGAISGNNALMRGDQILQIFIQNNSVKVGELSPLEVLSLVTPLPLDWAKSGIDAWVPLTAESGTSLIFKGTAVLAYNIHTNVAAPLSYLGSFFGNWPTTWNPTLAHAPNGRDGNLWSVLPSAQGNWIMQHDGDVWQQVPNQADHVGVGQDNTVMIASASRLFKFTGTFDGYGFTPVSPANNLIQVSLGDANHVYARDTSNNVYSFDSGSGVLTPNATTGPATHIAATYDGSLWHAKPNNNNMHRYLSGPNVVDAIPVKQGFVNTVQKVAGTGFGAAHCLVQQASGGAAATTSTSLYRYDSPYVFKTAGSYFNTGKTIENAMGRLYLSILDTDASDNQQRPYVLAIDPHTGVELARTTFKIDGPPGGYVFTSPVFDPVRRLIYVGLAPQDRNLTSFAGGLVAFDAQTLSQAWFSGSGAIDVQPTLIGQYLYFSDRQGNILKFDAAAKLANPSSNPLIWGAQPPDNPPPPHFDSWPVPLRGASAFAMHAGKLYATVWNFNITCKATDIINTEIWSSNTSTWVSINDADGAVTVLSGGLDNHLVSNVMDVSAFIEENHYGFAPQQIILPTPTADDPNATAPALVINGGNAVRLYQLPTSPTESGAFLAQRFDTPGEFIGDLGLIWIAAVITTGFAYDDGLRPGAASVSPSLWFGISPRPGSQSAHPPFLCNLDFKLQSINGTPASVTETTDTVIRSTPVLYKDTRGDLTVMFGLSDAGSRWGSNITTNTPDLAGLYGYAPDTGNLAQLDTGTTQLTALSREDNHGVIYGAGSRVIGTEYAQVLGIRVDELVQDERDFIIEAELMQDFDATSPNSFKDPTNPTSGIIPPSYMRYKAHVTVVDGDKQARPNEPVKVWCDVPNTAVTINGDAYTIGPDDDAYALAQTDVDGVLVLSVGNHSKDSSGNMTDAPDINAQEFRVWAPFMDPYERIVVFLDQEWHGRMTNATNDYNDNGKNPDPDKPNLSTVRNLQGEPLFDDDDKADDAPQKIANSIQQMKQSTNVGQGGSASLAGALQTVHAKSSSASYVAYNDLPGMHYAPNNAQTQRPATATAPMGFAFTRDVANKKSTFTVMSHTQASDAMDALTTGVPRWDPNSPTVIAALAARPQGAQAVQSNRKNGFQKLWDWLKQGLAKLESVLISVTDTVLTTISMVLPDGTRQVFQWLAQGIEDVVNVIGMLINLFEKAVDDALAAIGFQQFFDEWFNTQDWLTAQLNTLTGDMSKYLVNNVKPILDNYIEGLEKDVSQAFQTFKAAFTGQSISSLQGGTTTPHTAFTVGGPGTPAKSHAVVCMDTAHTLKTQLRKASVSQTSVSQASAAVAVPSRATEAAGTDGDSVADPVADFINSFLKSLTTDPVLSAALKKVKNDVSNLFTVQGLQNFFTNLIGTLIDIIETLVVGALAVCKAFLDGLFAVIADVITDIMNLLNAEIDIPVISNLYQFLFDQPLTLLNVGTLVASLVVNLVYRILQGKYPSQDGALAASIPPALPAPPATSSSASALTVTAATTAASKKAQLALGITNGIMQILYGIMSAVNDAADEAWAPLQKLTAGVGLFMACVSTPWISDDDPDEGAQCIWGFETMAPALLCILATVGPADEELTPWVLAFVGLVQLGTSIYVYATTANPESKDKLGLTIGVCSAVPLMVNPAIQAGPWGKAAVVVIDILGNGIAGGCAIALAVVSYNTSTTPAPRRQYYLPWVAANA